MIEIPTIRHIRSRLDSLVWLRTVGGWTPEEEVEYAVLVGYEARYLASHDALTKGAAEATPEDGP